MNSCINCDQETIKSKLCRKCYCKKYRETHHEEILLKAREYRDRLSNSLKEKSREYYESHRDARREYNRKNKEKHLKYQKDRKENVLNYKIGCNLRTRLYKAIKNGFKAGSAIKDLGCTVEELKVYLESKWLPGMTWDNWNRDGWHIDHVKPLCCFDLTGREQFLKACHYTNLQPLWAEDNLKKNRRLINEVGNPKSIVQQVNQKRNGTS